MNLNQIRDNKGSRYKAKRVGRGLGSGKGKTCGSGYKGQKSRTGVSINGFEGGQMPIYRRLPKRGFNNIFGKVIETINLGQIQNLIDKNLIDTTKIITKNILKSLNLISNEKNQVKILAKGELKKSISIEIELYSKKALELISKNGGKVIETI
ncbi:MAG: 50S ribosomal protein L15 [Rickettsiales bacterium]|nr:MAG: 50S ribosomal protein L15 [Rickettsiales bacterium]